MAAESDLEWLPLEGVAAWLGLSSDAFERFVREQDLRVFWIDGNASVRRQDLDAAIGRARLSRPTSNVGGTGLIGLPAAARLVGVGHEAARRAVLDGRLPATRVGRLWQLREEDVLAWAAETNIRR